MVSKPHREDPCRQAVYGENLIVSNTRTQETGLLLSCQGDYLAVQVGLQREFWPKEECDALWKPNPRKISRPEEKPVILG